MTMFDKGTQKELKDQYRGLMTDVWEDESMIDFCTKKADVIIKFDNGFFAEVEKESIKKNFCFGYSDSMYDTKDYDRANNMAHYAKTSVDYFRKENLNRLNKCIEFYSDTRNKLFFQNHYTGQKNNILKCIDSFKEWDCPKDIFNKEYKIFTPLSEKDRALLVDAYKKELELFTKRLETYIKRYGLSKVRSWSYWRDE